MSLFQSSGKGNRRIWRWNKWDWTPSLLFPITTLSPSRTAFRFPGHLMKTSPCYSLSKGEARLQRGCSAFCRCRLKTRINTRCSSTRVPRPAGTGLIRTDQVCLQSRSKITRRWILTYHFTAVFFLVSFFVTLPQAWWISSC